MSASFAAKTAAVASQHAPADAKAQAAVAVPPAICHLCSFNHGPVSGTQPSTNPMRDGGADIRSTSRMHLEARRSCGFDSDEDAIRRRGGDERTRTADPLLAKQVLYQLSYVPLFACGDSEPRPCTRLRRWITSQQLTDRAEMRDADMSVSTGQSVGDVRPRFISA